MFTNVVSAHGGIALYRQVADVLRGKISRGEFPPGYTLPAENDMAAEYGVGRDSMREAIALLRNEGLIETRRGFRSKVRQAPVRTRIEIASGAVVTARMPTPEERIEHDVFEGVPMVVVEGGQAYPADRFELYVP